MMLSVLALIGLPILCGIGWRAVRPGGLDADLVRLVLATLVFNLLLPVLVFAVLWRSRIGLESLRIALFGTAFILFGASLTWLVARLWRIDRRRLGAAMLGVAFPNVTYLGMPILEQAFGPWTRSLVIQLDMFAGMPMVLTLGVAIGRHYGEDSAADSLLRSLLKNPPLWAAVLAVLLNLGGVSMPPWLGTMCDRLAAAVIPLMLITLGLGLRWDSWRWRNAPLAALVLASKLLAVPWFGVALGSHLGFVGDTLAALVMEAGMPSMFLGVVYCDRYRLDTSFYAMIVSLTTLVGLFSLPFWQHRLA